MNLFAVGVAIGAVVTVYTVWMLAAALDRRTGRGGFTGQPRHSRRRRGRGEHFAVVTHLPNGPLLIIHCPDCARACRHCHGRSPHFLAITNSAELAAETVLDHQLETKETL